MPIDGQAAAHVPNMVSIVKNLQRLHTEGPFSDNKDIQNIYAERLFLAFLSKSLLFKGFFNEIEERISDIKFRNVLLIIPEDKIFERIADSRQRRNARWCDYFRSFKTLEHAADYFKAQQRIMQSFAKQLSGIMRSEIVVVASPSELITE